ncbi:SipW-dependent-type signal peptide-containing protein [Thomasclavelia sp.]
MNKKLKLGLASLALVGVMVVGGSLAYFTDTDTKNNIVTLGKVEGNLEEDTDEKNVTKTEDGLEYEDNITPGKELSKKPYLVLDQKSEDAYARVMISVNGINGDGSELTDQQKAKLNELGFDYNNDEGWFVAEDGYVYYNTKLTQEDPKTAYVFTNVTFPSSWGNEMANVKITITVKGELIQADNFTPTLTDGHITSWGNVDIEAAN